MELKNDADICSEKALNHKNLKRKGSKKEFKMISLSQAQ
jgi:hypothetical protein